MSERSGGRPERSIDDYRMEIIDIDDQSVELFQRREAIVSALREKFREGSLAEEDRLAAWVLIHASAPKSGEPIINKINRLKTLSQEVQANQGKPVVWLSREEKTVAYRDPGPNETQTRDYLNIGLLPYNAELKINLFEGSIPVEKAVQLSLITNQGEDLSWDTENLGYRLFSAPEWIPNPEIHFASEGLFSIADSKMVRLPWPVMGDKAIKELFDKHKMEEDPRMVGALNKLTETLFEA